MGTYRIETECVLNPGYHMHHDAYKGRRRASDSIKKAAGSFTVEAAFAVPLLMAAMVALIFFLSAIQTQVKLQKALYHQIKSASGYGYYMDAAGLENEAVSFLEAEFIKFAVISEVGEEYLRHSFIRGGCSGIFLNITGGIDTDLVDVALEYRMRPPYDLLGIWSLTLVTRAQCRTWTGSSPDDESENITIVYITADGEVYHRDRNCVYIKINYESCDRSEIDSRRNESGARYYLCEYCEHRAVSTSVVYFMKYGTRYHTTPDCPNMKRNIFSVDLETAEKTRRPCSRCGGK